MYKKIILIAPLLIGAIDNNNNNAQIPPAPSIVGFYNQEIARFDKRLEPLKLQPDFDKKWELSCNVHLSHSNLYRELSELEKEYRVLGITRVYMAQDVLVEIFAEHENITVNQMRIEFNNDNKRLKEKIAVHTLRFDYELKREFLKKFNK
jgi:hypothetical protein